MNIPDINEIKNFLSRNVIWMLLIAASLLIIMPKAAEIRTFFLIISVECLAVFMSAIAVHVFTAIDFTVKSRHTLGYIFLGVHICVGFVVLGVYIAQFSP
ncbi:MAG: hypothetical protein WC313_05515 [Candidatus Kapaibacterium sp.]|jgi:hypothetical protein|nr:hypothetical protein [Candidatus Kapabacteria bacterium]